MQVDRRRAMMGMAAAPLVAAFDPAAPVTVVEARRIVTMEAGLPQARFMAMSGGMVLALADSLQALAPWTDGRQVTHERRFAGQVIFPGLIDPHIHPMQSAVMLGVPFLAPDDWTLPSGHWPGVIGEEAYRQRLARIVDRIPENPAIVWGHHELFHGPMSREFLDRIAPDRPVAIWQRSFHDIYVNSAALAWMKLADRSVFEQALAAAGASPEHGDFDRGMFSETALKVAIDKLRPVLLAPDRLKSGFAGLQAMMASRGVTTTADLATGVFAGFEAEAGLIGASFNRPDSASRIALMAIATEIMPRDDLSAWFADAKARHSGRNVRLDRRIKLFADGAFFAQNMRMAAPGYSDGHIGKWLTEPEELHHQLERFWQAGFALHIHVNGDEGAEVLLDGLEKLPLVRGRDIVLEHLGYCSEAQIRRIARMGLMVSAQPNYIRVLGEAYGRRGFGPDRAALINRLGSLERAQVPLGLHSDFNMAPIDPFYLAWIAQTREGLDGVGRAPDERLSRAKALRAITTEAAQVIGMDREVGSLAAGKRADFIVLDHDPREVETAALKELPILATAFEGRIPA